MQTSIAGEAIILSQDDADQIAQAVADLTEVIWNTLARRRIILHPPAGHKPARLKPKVPPPKAPLDELF